MSEHTFIRYKKVLLVVAMLSIALGALVVIGWVFDIGTLKSVVPGYASMKLNSAISFIVSGVLVYTLANMQSKSVVSLLCSFLILLNTSSLMQDFLAADFGIDELLMADSDSRIQGSHAPGRTATSTAFCFTLVGISLLLLQRQKTIAQYSLHLISLVSFIAIIGYFYAVPALYSLSFPAAMPVHTAGMFFVFSLGVSLYNPHIGITGIFTGSGIGNRIARRLFPAIVLAILILGFLRTEAHKYHLVSVEFGIALFAISFILVSLFLLRDTTRLLNSMDVRKSRAENEFIRANKELLFFQGEEKQKLTDELILSEKRLNAAQNIAKIGSWDFNLQTFTLIWSREHYRIFELEETPAEKLYDAYRSKIHPDDIPELDRVVNLAIEKGLGFQYEHRVLCKDGSIKNVLGIGHTMNDADGKAVSVQGTVQDITERKKIKNELINANRELLSQNEEKEKQATELMRSVILLEESQSVARLGGWELNLLTGELYWTAETYRIHDTSPEEFNPTVDAGVGYFLPASKATIMAALDAAITHGEGYDLYLETYTTKGRKIDVRTTGVVTVENGKPVKLAGIFQDITARRKIEKELELTHERLALAASTANIGIWELDISDNNLIWNEQMFALYGITRETFSKTYDAWRVGLHPEDRGRAEEELNHAIAGGKSFNTEFRVVWPDKSVHHLQAFAKVIFDSSGKALKMIGTNYDVTHRKEKEKELVLLNATKDKFFSIVAHDLKSPISALKGFSSLLVDQYDELTKEDILKMARELKYSVENTLKMADNLIDWAKIQMNDVQNKPEPVLIQELVDNICEVYEEIALGKGISLSCSVEDSLIVLGDKNQIEFVVRNLVNNAIKFTGKGGSVHVVAKSLSEEDVEISVSDNGAGISEAMKAKLFSVGKSHSTVGTAGEKGTGLGLMLSYEFAKLNGGQIDIESTLGKGTTFRTTFRRT